MKTVLPAILVAVATAVSLGLTATVADDKPPPASAAATTATLQEGFSFSLQNLQVSQQGGNTLDLSVRYAYRAGIRNDEYPDYRLLARTCEEFLRDYPNKKAFWEVLNKELTATLLERFPALNSITVEMQVEPTSTIPQPRASTVTRTR